MASTVKLIAKRKIGAHLIGREVDAEAGEAVEFKSAEAAEAYQLKHPFHFYTEEQAAEAAAVKEAEHEKRTPSKLVGKFEANDGGESKDKAGQAGKKLTKKQQAAADKKAAAAAEAAEKAAADAKAAEDDADTTVLEAGASADVKVGV